ncbi:MAG: hypothetical protein R3C17_16845 [Planctomycetaceae bacterium]
MNISAEYIDQIVQNVMREMQTRVPMTDVSAPVETKQTAAAETLQIGSRVVSENVLISANAAGRAITLAAGAVITPSGRDYIRKNGVRLVSDAGLKNSVSNGGTFISIGDITTSSAAAAAGWKMLTAPTEFGAATLASEKLATGIVTSFGGEPSVVACLLNRNPAVRAAVVTRTTNLATLTSVMNPQVVCLDATGWSFAELLRLLRGLSMSSVIPKQWKEIV